MCSQVFDGVLIRSEQPNEASKFDVFTRNCSEEVRKLSIRSELPSEIIANIFIITQFHIKHLTQVSSLRKIVTSSTANLTLQTQSLNLFPMLTIPAHQIISNLCIKRLRNLKLQQSKIMIYHAG
jgi:hypothetical protein